MVAVVPVAFWKVKFWRVEELLRSKLVNVPSPETRSPKIEEFALRLVEEAKPEI